MKPRCGKKLKAYVLGRVRGQGSSVCGLPEGHRGRCLSEETLRRSAGKRNEWKRKNRNTKEETRKRMERKRRARSAPR
jgi:hypothetical protein